MGNKGIIYFYFMFYFKYELIFALFCDIVHFRDYILFFKS